MRSSFIRLSSVSGAIVLVIALISFGGSNVQARLSQQATVEAASSGMAGACPQGLAAQVAQSMGMAGGAASGAAGSGSGGASATMSATMSATTSATMSATSSAGGETGGGTGAAVSGPVCLVALMSGPVEVPPGDPKGTGFAAITIDAASNSVTFDVVVSGIALPATAMHIHQAAAGVAGGIVVPAKQAPDASGLVTTTTTGVDPALIGQIISNPSGFYVNVHNAAFPGGALRGQLEPYNPGEYPAGGAAGGASTGAATPMAATATPAM